MSVIIKHDYRRGVYKLINKIKTMKEFEQNMMTMMIIASKMMMVVMMN